MTQYELHPLCTLFPRLGEGEFAALVSDIRANGLREPITLHDGMVLDGGNRYRACLAAGVEPRFREHSGGNIVAFVLSANLHRRHLSPGQQAAIVASAQDWAQAQTRGGTGANQHAAQTGKITGLQTVADRAAQSGASEKTQRMADKVAKADPELAREVAHGTKSLPQAIEELTGKRPGAKPAAPIEDDGPSAEEIADAERAAEEDAERVRLLLDSDDAMKALADKCKQLQAENAALRARVGGLQGELAQAIRMVKMWRTKAEKVAA